MEANKKRCNYCSFISPIVNKPEGTVYIACVNIDDGSKKKSKFFVKTELENDDFGAIVVQYEISYCPMCGKKLNN